MFFLDFYGNCRTGFKNKMRSTNYFPKIHELISTCCFFLIYNVSSRKPIKSHENLIQSPKCTYKF